MKTRHFRYLPQSIGLAMLMAVEAAKHLEADALEQMGHQAESANWRNIFLVGAHELRNGVQRVSGGTASIDTLRAMSIDILLDYPLTGISGTFKVRAL